MSGNGDGFGIGTRARGGIAFAALVVSGALAGSAGALPQSSEQAPSQPPADKETVPLADSDLRDVVAQDVDPGDVTNLQETADGLVVEVIFRNGDAAAARDAIRDAGGEPGITVPGELVQAEVPVGGLVELEADPAVEFVRPPLDYDEPVVRDPEIRLEALSPSQQGAFEGEQISKTNAGAWHAAGITGAGIKVGIIDSFSLPHYNTAVAAGEIPAANGTFCLNNGTPCNVFASGERHGIGVAEAVIDMAPGAQIYFADVTSVADAQAALNYFASQGVRVVTRSQTGRYDGPGNGTGPIASVIESSAVGQGMFYLNSAGNSAGRFGSQGSYFRGVFSDPDADGWHNFGPTDEMMQWDCSFQNGLRWSDFGEGAQTTDYDLYVYNNAFVQTDVSADGQGGAGSAPPIELATGCTTTTSYVAIYRYATHGGDTGDVLEFMTNGAFVEYPTNPFSATGPMSDLNSPGAVSVGAVDPALGTDIARYSSEGPTNDGRIKPDLSAAACVQSISYSPGCFNGTSSSTPVTAGAAALILSGGGANSPAEVKNFLLGQSTTDRGAAGPDNIYGQGELLLPPVTVLDRQAPTVQALPSKGKQGRKANLRYTASDNSGLSAESVRIVRRGKQIGTIQSEFGESTGGTYVLQWRVPRRVKGKMNFCVTSADGNGNTSAESCAKLKIKKKRRGR